MWALTNSKALARQEQPMVSPSTRMVPLTGASCAPSCLHAWRGQVRVTGHALTGGMQHLPGSHLAVHHAMQAHSGASLCVRARWQHGAVQGRSGAGRSPQQAWPAAAHVFPRAAGMGPFYSFMQLVGDTNLTSCLPNQDRPLFAKDGRIIFASTHRPAKKPRQGWTAIYSLSGGAPVHLLLSRTKGGLGFGTRWRRANMPR